MTTDCLFVDLWFFTHSYRLLPVVILKLFCTSTKSKQKQFCDHVLHIIVNPGKSSKTSKQCHVRSWLTYRNHNSVWWTLSCIVMNVAKSLNAKSRCYFRKTFTQFRKDYYKKWIWKDFHKNLTMGGLTLPHSRVSYQRRRTSVFWWIPWHLHWCHPSKASQIRIRLPKNKKMKHLESIIQWHTKFPKEKKYTVLQIYKHTGFLKFSQFWLNISSPSYQIH